MLSREAYEKIGAHKKIALRPDEDLQLGILVKNNGLKQRLLIGKNHIQVEWYEDFFAMMNGLEKNIFAGLHYSILMLIAAILAMIIFYIGPFLGVWVLDGWHIAVCGLSIIMIWIIYLMYTRKLFKDSGIDVFLFPVLAVLLIYVFIRSCFLTVYRGGIRWRSTFYSLKELKRYGK